MIFLWFFDLWFIPCRNFYWRHMVNPYDFHLIGQSYDLIAVVKSAPLDLKNVSIPTLLHVAAVNWWVSCVLEKKFPEKIEKKFHGEF